MSPYFGDRHGYCGRICGISGAAGCVELVAFRLGEDDDPRGSGREPSPSSGAESSGQEDGGSGCGRSLGSHGGDAAIRRWWSYSRSRYAGDGAGRDGRTGLDSGGGRNPATEPDPEGKGKKVLNSVGRFLHMVKKKIRGKKIQPRISANKHGFC